MSIFFQIQENKQRFNNIKQQVLSLIKEQPLNNDILYEMYKTCVNHRHDFIHLFVAEKLGMIAQLGVSQTLEEFFNLPIENVGNYTPDIIFLRDRHLEVIDVTCSVNPGFMKTHKTLKYSKVCESLVIQGLISDFKVTIIAIHPSLVNLQSEMLQLFHLSDIQVGFFTKQFNFFEQVVNTLKVQIPNIYFEREGIEPNFRTEFYKPDMYASVTKHDAFSPSNYSNISTVFQFMDTLLLDKEVQEKLKDEKNTIDSLIKGFESLKELEPAVYAKPRPTYHFIHARPVTLPNQDYNLQVDQSNNLNILTLLSKMQSEHGSVAFCKSVYESLKSVLDDKQERILFETGFYTGTHEGDSKIRTEKVSMRNILLMRKSAPFAERSNQLRVKFTDQKAKFFKNASGVNFEKNNPQGRTYKESNSCSPENAKHFESFYNTLSQETNQRIKLPELFEKIGSDAKFSETFKKESIDEFKSFFSWISSSMACNFSYHNYIAADQLIHFCGLNTTEKSFYLVNTGLPNVMHIAQGGKVNRAKDVGQPFITIAVTKNPLPFKNVFGDINTFQENIDGIDYFIHISNWRRLQVHKLALIRDQFFQTLSTGFDSFMRQRHNITRSNKNEMLKNIYSFKVCVASCTSQRVAEFLMDTRYILMACFSDYTSVHELIADKFKPAYPNCFSRWIIEQLERKSLQIMSEFDPLTTFKANMPIFQGNERSLESMGGTINIMSLWSNVYLTDIQDVFDELFVYVLTGKEPSSEYHEAIKSMETILKYQKEYEGLTLEARQGFHTPETFKQLLLSGKHVGFYRDACYNSAKMVGKKYINEKTKANIDKMTSQEVLSEIVSTKVCLPELPIEIKYENDRQQAELNSNEKLTRSQAKKKIKMIRRQERIVKQLLKRELSPIERKVGISVIGEKTDMITPGLYNKRVKVHDATVDMIKRFPGTVQTVLDVAHWNIFLNSNRVVADICIKAQYGAKREFYVLNYGAKCQMRIFENIFKAIAKELPQEMISVPGDQKMIKMSENLDNALKGGGQTTDILMYVNGDCTKWSAGDTMGSFAAMVDGLADYIGDDKAAFCKCVLSGWADKQILIPNVLMKSMSYITEKNEYMGQKYYIESNQNFLQGLMNYSSSCKAVFATELAIAYWEYKYKGYRRMIVQHMEHSDDYQLIIRCNKMEDFEEFRMIHKLCQRMHGVSDSKKKTNCQRFIMEFISLMSFNGKLAYPHIKKTKETGINIAAQGYQYDIKNVQSRVAESCRLGVPLTVCYIQGRIQGWSIYYKYSLNKRNKMHDNPYDIPCELFGLPDCMPNLYLHCKGDPDLYRLSKYSVNADLVKKLIMLQTKLKLLSLGDEQLVVTGAHYVTRKASNRLQYIRAALGLNYEEVNKILEENPDFLVLKPRETNRLYKWLIYMYYNNSFAMAYNQLSRQAVNLRLSFFVTGKCIRYKDEYIGLIEYHDRLMSQLNEMQQVTDEENLAINLGLDPSIAGMFDILESAGKFPIDEPPIPPFIHRLPQTFKFLQLSHNITDVLAYMINKAGFEMDRRRIISIAELEHDCKRIKELLKVEKIESHHMLPLLHILKAQGFQTSVALTYGHGLTSTTIECFIGSMENNMKYFTRYHIYMPKHLRIFDPFSGEILYQKDGAMHNTLNSIMLENMCQAAYYLIFRENMPIEHFADYILGSKVLGKETVRDVLTSASMDMSTSDDLHHKRMLAFFKSALLGDDRLLRELIHTGYNIMHCYINGLDLDRLSAQLGKHVREAVSIRFRGMKSVTVCLDNNEIFTFTGTQDYRMALMQHTIGCKHLNIITQKDLENALTGKKRITLSTTNTSFNAKWDYWCKRDLVFTTGPPGEHLPIVAYHIKLGQKIMEKTNLEIEPTTDLERLTCVSGQAKLFTLPLYACGKAQVIEFNYLKLKSGINFNVFNYQGLLYSYLNNKLTGLWNTGIDSDELLVNLNIQECYPNSFIGKADILIERQKEIEKNLKNYDLILQTPQKRPELTIKKDELNLSKIFNFSKTSFQLTEEDGDIASEDEIVEIDIKNNTIDEIPKESNVQNLFNFNFNKTESATGTSKLAQKIDLGDFTNNSSSDSEIIGMDKELYDELFGESDFQEENLLVPRIETTSSDSSTRNSMSDEYVAPDAKGFLLTLNYDQFLTRPTQLDKGSFIVNDLEENEDIKLQNNSLVEKMRNIVKEYIQPNLEIDETSSSLDDYQEQEEMLENDDITDESLKKIFQFITIPKINVKKYNTFSEDKIRNLPEINMYLLRCIFHNQATPWLANLRNMISLFDLINKEKIEMQLTKKEQGVLTYLYEEASLIINAPEYSFLRIEFKDCYVALKDKNIRVYTGRAFNTEELARRFASRTQAEVHRVEDKWVVQKKIENFNYSDVATQPVEFPKGKMWKLLEDIFRMF